MEHVLIVVLLIAFAVYMLVDKAEVKVVARYIAGGVAALLALVLLLPL